MSEQKSIFRQKTLDRLSSPEQLQDYLRVTSPGLWTVLISIILLLTALLAWSFIGTLETTSKATVVVKDQTAIVVISGTDQIDAGMKVRVFENEYTIASVETDEYGRTLGSALVSLPDGNYEGTVVVETVKPIDFLISQK